MDAMKRSTVLQDMIEEAVDQPHWKREAGYVIAGRNDLIADILTAVDEWLENQETPGLRIWRKL